MADDKFVVFERWLLSSGAKFPKLELRQQGSDAEMRGCHSVEGIVDDEVIIEIPLKCLITVEMGKETDVGMAIIGSGVELDAPKHIYLMLFMLLDRKNPDSFFKPYYDILPPSLSNMPVFWSEEELDYLKGSHILSQIDDRKMAIDSDYHTICEISPIFGTLVTAEEFAWARMCVCSRNFGVQANGIRTAALVPYADMLNHLRPRETKWQFEDSRQAFTVSSLMPIGAGAEVFDSYGQKCNHRFLLNYGYSVENNVETDGFCPNEVPLLMQLRSEDPLYDEKCTRWLRDGYLPSRRIRVSVGDSDSSKLLMCLLRIISLDESDFHTIEATFSGSFKSIRELNLPINVANETRSLILLNELCDDYLSRYPTTLQEDLEMLKDGKIPEFSNRRNALIQVKGEKVVLHHYKDLTETALNFLRVSSSMTEKEVKYLAFLFVLLSLFTFSCV
jgi:histone-lysine N-methyltransferase SETD3